MLPYPHLTRGEYAGIGYYSDPALERCGVALCFTERTGGVSKPPYESLDLGTHVGDDSVDVAENRRRVVSLLAHRSSGDIPDEDNIARLASRLCVPDQTHGDHLVRVEATTSSSDLTATDALIVAEPAKPIMLCFADCVPVVLVAPGPAVALAHAGWKGAIASLPGKAATRLAQVAHCDVSEINAYIGAHIRDCCYETSEDILGRFVEAYGEGCRVGQRNLSLSCAVRASLSAAGIEPRRIAEIAECTSCAADRFFSYRASGPVTGRHCAAAVIAPPAERP